MQLETRYCKKKKKKKKKRTPRKPIQPRIRFYIAKLNGLTVMSAFQATIGSELTLHATLVDEDAELDSKITFFNEALTGPGRAKMCLMSYANNKSADQPAHPRSLISTFVVRCLDSMICTFAISKVYGF